MFQLTTDQILQKFLMCSYMYYIKSKAVLPDEEYDQMAKLLLKEWDNFEHPHKYLVTKEDLEAGTLYGVKESDYPKIVIGGANLMLDVYEKSVQTGTTNG